MPAFLLPIVLGFLGFLPGLLKLGGVYLSSYIIASIVIYVAGSFLGLVGLALDILMQYAVVAFTSTVYAWVYGGVVIVWSVGRDIANIVIIGVFVFIAISTILGSTSYGMKRMVARVLIIAVLINFSLLFTRVVVDASNFVAGKFYQQMTTTSAANPATPSPTAGSKLSTIENYASTAGVSGQFISLLGLPSSLVPRATIGKIAEEGARNTPSPLGGITNTFVAAAIAILYGLVMGGLMLILAFVLGYAVFMLLVRTILFVILLAFSAAAFGAFLVPRYGEYVWEMWWDALWRSAIIAPVLLIMIWTTLTISYGFVNGMGGIGPGKKASFDALFSNPTSGAGVLALLAYLVVVGMLYLSIRIASSFGGSIRGFRFGDTSALTAAPFSLASRFGVAPLGRLFLGRRAYERAAKYEGLRDKAIEKKEWRWAGFYDRKRQKASARASSDFNPMNTMLGKQFAKGTGLATTFGGLLAGTTKGGGYASGADAAIKAVTKQLGSAASNKEAEKAVAEGVKSAITTAHAASTGEGGIAATRKQAADTELANAMRRKEELEREHAAAQAEAETRTQEAKTKRAEHEQRIAEDAELTQLRREMASETDVGKSTVLNNRINARERQMEIEHQTAMRTVNTRIEAAQKQERERFTTLQRHSENIPVLRDQVKDAQTLIKEAGESLKEAIKTQTEIAINKSREEHKATLRAAARELLPRGRRSDVIVAKVEGSVNKAGRIKDLGAAADVLKDIVPPPPPAGGTTSA